MLASEIMDLSAALQNDPNKEQYTFDAQLPYLKMALKELKEYYELNDLPITNESSALIVVPLNTTILGLNTVPALPADLIEIQNLYESTTGLEQWTEIKKREFLPKYINSILGSSYLIYAWQANQIRLPLINQARDIKIDYIRNMFMNIVDENSTIDIISGDSFLIYRTGALCAEFIGEDKGRATDLNGNASLALDRITGIGVKGTQGQSARRRPFRSRYILRSGR